jgi:hypothetical protein
MFVHESGHEAVRLAQRCSFGHTPLHDVGGQEKRIGSRFFGGIRLESHAFEQKRQCAERGVEDVCDGKERDLVVLKVFHVAHGQTLQKSHERGVMPLRKCGIGAQELADIGIPFLGHHA